MSELIEVSKQDKVKLAKICSDAIDDWIRNSGEHHANLRRWNDLVEQVVESSDFPWPGSSDLHVPLIATHVVTLHSVIARSMTTVSPLWYGSSLNDDLRKNIPEVESMLDFKAKSETNILEAFRDVIFTTARDGIGWIKMMWVEEFEKVNDVAVVESEKDFREEFPDADSAGYTEEEYEQKLKEIREKASTETPIDIPVTYDRLCYKGPKAFVVEEVNMVRVPMTATELKECIVYGQQYYEMAESLKSRAKQGSLWEEEVEALIKKKSHADTKSRTFKDQIEGIRKSESKIVNEFCLYELIVKTSLGEDEEDNKYIVNYSKDHRKILGVSKYDDRKEMYHKFRMIKRPNRMLGRSIPSLLEELNKEVDLSIQQDINSGTIELVPSFKAKRDIAKDFDPTLDENQWKPGVIFWMKDPDAFQQFKINPADKSAGQNRRQELLRYSELLVGPTQLLSGRESPLDPDAPGNKTIALIQQSNMRIEDYINEIRLGFDELGDHALSLYYQRGPEEIKYQSKEEVKSIRRKMIRRDIKLKTHGVTATMNPEIEFAKALQWFTILKEEPQIGADPDKRRNLLNRLMLAGRLEGRDELLPDKQEVEEEKRKKMKEEIIQELVAQGAAIPGVTPPPPPVPPAPLAPGLDQGPAVPGTPGGAVGLPPVNNLPEGL